MDSRGLEQMTSSMWLSEDTLVLNSTPSELENLELYEKVDLIITTLGSKPPTVPLREERVSLGVECVYRAKGVAWSGVKKNCKRFNEKKIKKLKTKRHQEQGLPLPPMSGLICCAPFYDCLVNEEGRSSKSENDSTHLQGILQHFKALSYREYLEYLERCIAKRIEQIEFPYIVFYRARREGTDCEERDGPPSEVVKIPILGRAHTQARIVLPEVPSILDCGPSPKIRPWWSYFGMRKNISME